VSEKAAINRIAELLCLKPEVDHKTPSGERYSDGLLDLWVIESSQNRT